MEIILRKFGCGWQSFFINETIYIFNPKKKVAIKQSLNFGNKYRRLTNRDISEYSMFDYLTPYCFQ